MVRMMQSTKEMAVKKPAINLRHNSDCDTDIGFGTRQHVGCQNQNNSFLQLWVTLVTHNGSRVRWCNERAGRGHKDGRCTGTI